MPRVDLHSTVLEAAAYHHLEALLELQFSSGAVYQYFGVPEQTYQELLSAESQGAYFNHHIRNRFVYAQVHPAELTSDSPHSRHPHA